MKGRQKMKIPRITVIITALLAALALGTASASAAQPAGSIAASSRTTTIVHGDLVTTITSGTEPAAAQTAGVSCATGWTGMTQYQLGQEAFAFKASTYYCWNGVIVTYHDTTYYWTVTWFGNHLAGLGWQDGYILFNCYVANGSSRNCSGNYEQTVGQFGTNTGGYGGSGEQVTINQWENYHGQFFTNWSTQGY